MIFNIVAVGIGLYVIKFLFTTDPPPINGIYSQPGKWYTLKYWAFFVIFKLRQRQNQKLATVKEGSNAGYGMRSKSTVEDMEKVQKLPEEYPLAVDAVYFNGGNKNGQYFVAATARRHEKLTQTLLYIRIPDLGLLELPSLPDTSLYRDEEMTYAAGGLKMEPVISMKTWKLSYTGKMRLVKSETEKEEVDVSFSLDWEAYTRYFDFDTDLNVHSICDSMAREKWTREFFDSLKKAHQTHYEQFGEISGEISIEKYGKKVIKVQGVRDHSYGNIRDWRHLHRYGIQYLHLEDKTAICIGVICMPLTMSRLIIGYVIHPDGKTMDVVTSTEMELHKIGEDGRPPIDFTIDFVAADKKYHLEGHVLQAPIFYMGKEWEARIHERMCAYKVNGVPGWGVSEWDYRNHTGKSPVYVQKKE